MRRGKHLVTLKRASVDLRGSVGGKEPQTLDPFFEDGGDLRGSDRERDVREIVVLVRRANVRRDASLRDMKDKKEISGSTFVCQITNNRDKANRRV